MLTRTTLWGLAGKPFTDCCAAAPDDVDATVASAPCPPEERLDEGGWGCVDSGFDVSGGTAIEVEGGPGLGAELAKVLEAVTSGSHSDLFCSNLLQ